MKRCTVASLKLKCKQISTKTNDTTTPIIPFAQQLNSVILVILLRIVKNYRKKNT